MEDAAFTHLVVIGCSAGGDEALSEVVARLPEDFSAPVIAQHIDPDRAIHLGGILSRRSTLPVRTVAGNEQLEGGVVFVVPADRHVNLNDSEISLIEDTRGRPTPSVDLLFGSAAESFGERLIAVILGGTGSDGTEGARRVRAAGGMVVARDPGTSGSGDIPGSIVPNAVDIVAGLERIGQILGEVVAGGVISEATTSDVERTRGIEGAVETPREHHGIELKNEEALGFARQGVYPPFDDRFRVRAHPSDDGDSAYFEDIITERKLAEETLRQNEARWRALIDKGADVITVSDRDGTVRFASPSVETVCGYAAEEFVGTHLFEAGRIHPDDLERCEEAFRELAGNPGSSIDLQHRYLHKSGEWRWLEGTFTSLFHDPTIGGLVANFRDITERKEAEESLRESEERYRNLFGSIDEGFCTIEVLFDENEKPVDYRFLEVNPSFDKQTGIEDAVGRRMREIAPRHEEHWFETYGKVALTGEPIRFESRAEQLHRWYDVYAFRVQEPELRRVAILFNDITERKRAEAVLREHEEWLGLAQQAARSGTWEWDLRSGEIRWSDAHRELFGFDSDGPVTRDRWWAAVHPDDLPRIEEAGRRCSEEGEEWPEIEYRISRGGNEEGAQTRWISARGRTIRGEDDRPVRILGISVDVTESKRVEKERDRLLSQEWVARAEVAERERISRELHDRVAQAMGVAHQSLQLYEYFAKSDPSQAAAKLDLAKRMTKTALESTRNLSMELRRSVAEEGLAKALQDLLEVSLPDGIHAELESRGEESRVPPHVRGQLFLILREAVRNAVEHSGAGRISVELDVTPEKAVGRVQDDGSGLPYKNDPAANSGVGMRSMRERAALLGGDVVIVSAPGEGTRVEASIPLEEA